jgi:hypothetical protein
LTGESIYWFVGTALNQKCASQTRSGDKLRLPELIFSFSLLGACLM